jgi:DNA-binding winged helix-turn-helix (wHTH) protein
MRLIFRPANYGRRVERSSFKVSLSRCWPYCLEKAGEVVTREELQLRVWGKNIVVDFDHSLGTAINKIRDALSDTADNPRFVETLAKRGYRFIAPVTVLGGSLATKATESMNLELTAESGSGQVVVEGPPGASPSN